MIKESHRPEVLREGAMAFNGESCAPFSEEMGHYLILLN